MNQRRFAGNMNYPKLPENALSFDGNKNLNTEMSKNFSDFLIQRLLDRNT